MRVCVCTPPEEKSSRGRSQLGLPSWRNTRRLSHPLVFLFPFRLLSSAVFHLCASVDHRQLLPRFIRFPSYRFCLSSSSVFSFFLLSFSSPAVSLHRPPYSDPVRVARKLPVFLLPRRYPRSLELTARPPPTLWSSFSVRSLYSPRSSLFSSRRFFGFGLDSFLCFALALRGAVWLGTNRVYSRRGVDSKGFRLRLCG